MSPERLTVEKDGLVQNARGHGLLVAPFDAHWLPELDQIRGTLDSLAARLAASCRAKLDPELLRHGRASPEAGDIRFLIDSDIAFHFADYAASGNSLTAETVRAHWGTSGV